MRRACYLGGLLGLERSLDGRSTSKCRRVASPVSLSCSTACISPEKLSFHAFLSLRHRRRLCQPFFASVLVTRTQHGNVKPMGMPTPHEHTISDHDTSPSHLFRKSASVFMIKLRSVKKPLTP